MNIVVNPAIGCKYPATADNILVRSMGTIIRRAANWNGSGRKPTMPDPNEGNARPWPSTPTSR